LIFRLERDAKERDHEKRKSYFRASVIILLDDHEDRIGAIGFDQTPISRGSQVW
jgi:hypothetical protein